MGLDYHSALPVRTEADGLDERLHAKIVDKDNPDTQQATVDTDSNLHVEAHGNRCDDGADVVLQLSEEGRQNSRGDYHADDNSCPSSTGVVAGIRSTNNLPADQTEHITSIENATGTVRALDVSIHDENGEPFGPDNPLAVTLEESEGDEIHDFTETENVVKDATTTHTYSVADARTLILHKVLVSGSGKLKALLEIGDGAAVEVFATKAVTFNSTANPQADIDFGGVPIRVLGTANTTTVRITLTNRDNQQQDLHSTFIGLERDTV